MVNCANSYEGNISKNIVDISIEDWKRTIEVNLNGYFLFSKFAIPLISKGNGGSINNISSCADFKVLKDYCVYPVTIAAMNALTRSLAIYFAPQIRSAQDL